MGKRITLACVPGESCWVESGARWTQDHVFSGVSILRIDIEGVHYVNTPMQYTAICKVVKRDNNFQMKSSDIFLLFASNIDVGTYRNCLI